MLDPTQRVLTVRRQLARLGGPLPLRPRFLASGTARPFVNREEAVELFRQELDRIGNGPRVLNITGIGGIGKSRLLRELTARVAETHRTATLDLQVPALRQPDAALAVLRAELGRQQVRFDHFDVAYTVLWQRLHPHLKVSRRDLPFVEHSNVLTNILDGVSGVPVFGTAVALLRLADALPSNIREHRALSRSPVLRQLDSLSNSELADAVAYLFAYDLRTSTEGSKPYVLFVDAYEALVGAHARTGRVVLSDAWLRDLVGQLDRGLCVLGSREPARWEEYDADWADVVRVAPLGDLPTPARLELLEHGGIEDERHRREIAHASSGVPFYLNLAADTAQHSEGGGARPGTVSTEQILQRFLHHVPPEEVRLLELLSLCRMFDRGVFEAVATEYRLPGHQLAWDSLTAYSFVHAPIEGQYQLHQLMVDALRSRVPMESATDVHRTLWRHWDSRVAPEQSSGTAEELTALREVVHHGLRASELTGDALLGYADRIVALGGAARIAPISDAARDVLQGSTIATDSLATAVQCLMAEAAYRAGATKQVPTAAVISGLEISAQVRLALTGAHALRVLGDTHEALDSYSTIWAGGGDHHHLAAGLWAADLHMVQGRFRDAMQLAVEVRTSAAGDAELQGDVARLLHLTHRFAFDIDASAQYLDEAAWWYEQASTAIGAANIQTNRAEHLAWIAPDRAVDAALEAIDKQRDVGAVREIGKSRTALALAWARLGELTRAQDEFERACQDLDRAGYRSGRARAELYRAALFARRGQIPAMIASVRWAVKEFEATEVYPSMILGAAVMLRHLGQRAPDVDAAADRAHERIHPLEDIARMDTRIERWMGSLVGDPG